MRTIVTLLVLLISSGARAQPPKPSMDAAQHKKAAKEHAQNHDELLATAQWRAAAELGDAEAQFTLARRLERGLGVTDYPDLKAKAKVEAEALDLQALAQGYPPAVDRVRKAAEQGDAKAQAKLGLALAAQGDYEGAIDYYRAALEAGALDAAGLHAMGDLLASGKVEAEPGEAVRVYDRAIAKGDERAEIALASLYFEGKGGVARDAEQGQRVLMKGVSKGRTASALELGRRFEMGDGLELNQPAALRVYTKCAARECVLARALLLVDGINVRHDARTAIDLLRDYAHAGWFPAVDALLTIANKGEQGAQLLIADMYLRGQGIEQDAYEAVRWYGEAAAQGNPGALFILGDLYARGDGVAQDAGKARDYFERASEAGSLQARARLSTLR